MNPPESPRISVLLPVYNAEQYLAEALDSLLGQSYERFEILAFDDGSSDRSIRILEEYSARDNRLKIYLRSHSGYSPHLNEGIQLATGEFIARMDSDDICHPNRFQIQLSCLAENADIVAVGSHAELIDEWGDSYSVQESPVDHQNIASGLLQAQGGLIIHPSVMIRKSALERVGGYRPAFEPAEDFDLWLRLSEVGLLANIPVKLLKYRVHSGMTSVANSEIQVTALNRALAEAWSRRNLDGLPPECPVSESVTSSEDERYFRLMKRALHNGFPRTARRYAQRLLVRNVFSLDRWSDLLHCIHAEQK